MEKNYRSIIAIIISVFLLINIMNINIVSAAGETTLPSGSTLTGTISTAGTENWYVINVTSAGNYTIET